MPKQKKQISEEERQQKRDQLVEDYLTSQMDTVITDIEAARLEHIMDIYASGIDFPGLKEKARELRTALKQYRDDPKSEEKKNELQQKGQAFLAFINDKGENVKQMLPRSVLTMDGYLQYQFDRSNMKKEVVDKFEEALDDDIDLYEEVSEKQVTKKKVSYDENRTKIITLQKSNIKQVVTEEFVTMRDAITAFNNTKEHFNSKEYEALKKEAKEYARKLNTLKKYMERQAFIKVSKKIEELDNHREALQYKLNAYIKKKEKDHADDPQKLLSDPRYQASLKLLNVNANYKKTLGKGFFGRRSDELMHMKQEHFSSVQSWKKNKEGFDRLVKKLEDADPMLTISSTEFSNMKKSVLKLQEEIKRIYEAKAKNGKDYDWRTDQNGETKKKVMKLLNTVYTNAAVYLAYKGDPKPGLEQKRVGIAKALKEVAEEQLGDFGRMEQKEKALKEKDLKSFLMVQKDQAEDDVCDLKEDFVRDVRQKADAARDALLEIVNGEDMAVDPKKALITTSIKSNQKILAEIKRGKKIYSLLKDLVKESILIQNRKAGNGEYTDEESLEREAADTLKWSGIETKQGKGQAYFNNEQLKEFLMQDKVTELALSCVAPEMVTEKKFLENNPFVKKNSLEDEQKIIQQELLP